MKIKAYAARPDELASFKKYGQQFGHQVSLERQSLSPQTAELAEGFEGVAILGNCQANREALEKLASYGIHYLASRSAGINNIDLVAAKELGIKVSNVAAYSPNAVSEFAVMSALALLRNLSQAIHRVGVQNFGLAGLIGSEMRNQTVGVIGTGRIGREAAKAYKGFGAEVIGFDLYESEEAKQYLTYHSLDEVLAKADILSFHCPLTDDNYHMVNRQSIDKMKDGVLIVNTARGGLIDAEAALEAIHSGKIGGMALDVYENEVGIVHHDHTNDRLTDRVYNELRALPNVIITPHFAFYTDEAVANMVEYSLDSLKQFSETGESSYEVKA